MRPLLFSPPVHSIRPTENRALSLHPGSVVLVLALFFFSNETAHAQWTQFGGPSRDFTSPEVDLLDRWPDDGLKPLWTTSLPGNYALPVIENDALYTLFIEGETTEVLSRLRVTDGKVVWSARFKINPDQERKDFGRGPNATPLLHGDSILTVGFTGQVRCLNKSTGETRWTCDLVAEYGAKRHLWGYSISPLAYRDTVLLGIGGKRYGVIALNIEDGEPSWKSESIDVSYASPFSIEVDGQEQVVLMASTEVVGLSPQTGTILWRFPHANVNKNNCMTPVWGKDNVLLIGSHSDGGAHALKLRQSGGGTTVEELWHNRKVFFFHASPIRVGDYAYGSSGTWSPTFLIGLHVETGSIAWRKRGYNKATCTYADGKFYILDEDGRLTLATLSEEGIDPISSFNPLESTAWAAPAIADGRLFLRDQKKVVAFDVRKSRSPR